MVLEDDPNFNAGKGAVFTADGFNELDASIMDGSTKKAGAVAMARHIKNPILGARLVMDKTWHTLVAGEGADKLAKENGLEMVDQKYFFTQFRYDALQKAKEKQKLLLDSEKVKKTSLNLHERPYLGTVGAIALDKNGNLAAATSTGGMTNKMTSRIGSYQRDSDKDLDLAISKKEFIDNFLKQGVEEGFSFEQTQELLGGIN